MTSAHVRLLVAFNFLLVFFVAEASLLCGQQRTEKPSSVPSGAEDSFTEAEPPPIRRIVIFNAGLSQMTHEGVVEGNQRIRMRFSEHDVDDVLKSLVFEDRDGGKVRSVQYNPAPDAQDVAATNLGPAMTLAQTLQEYRGEQVEIETKTRSYTGSILSVENRQTENAFIETLTIVNEDGFVSIPVNDFVTINFVDKKLKEEFNLAMSGLKKARMANSKEIVLLFEGKGKRRIRFSYNVDSPIWRMTYRLDLGDELSTLQGWAHIDNVTGIDWTDIELDLRSGRPQTFHVDLFAPVLAERMAVDLDVFDIPNNKLLITKSTGGRNFRGDDGWGDGGMGGGGFGGGGFGGGGFGGGGWFDGPAKSREADAGEGEEAMDIGSALESFGQTSRSNKMVRFKLKEKVTLKAGRSAMVPILKSEMPVGVFSMFVGSQSQDQAQHVARIENKTDNPLIPGPVSIYRKGDFLGDGALPRIDVGRKHEFVYGRDLSIGMMVKRDKPVTKFDAIRMVDNEIYIDTTQLISTTFTFKNDDNLPRNVLLKTPLLESNVTPEPAELENRIGTYTLECQANQTLEQKIQQRRVETKKVTARTIAPEEIAKWQKEGVVIDQGVIAAVNRVTEARTKLDKVSSEKQDAERVVSEIVAEQRRITDIVKVLSPNATAAAEYLKRLSQSEKELSEARQKLKEVEKRLKEERIDYENLLRSM